MKKQQKIKHFFVWVGVYRKQIMVILGAKTMKEAVAYVSKLKEVKQDFKDGFSKMEDEELQKGMCVTLTGYPPCLIFPSYDKKNIEDIACIVHETSHATDEICKQTWVKDEEARAYLQEYIFTYVKEGLDAKSKCIQ